MIDAKVYILFSAIVLFSYIGSLLYRSYAIKKELLAAVSQRSAHEFPTPTGSGIVLILIFLLSVILLWYWNLIALNLLLVCLAPIFVGLIGFIDDLGELPVKARVPLYFAAAIWCVYFLGFPVVNLLAYEFESGILGLFFGVVSLFWLQNLFNFMDGIDGIAGTEVLFVCTGAIVLGGIGIDEWMLLVIICALIAIGFLLTNLPPAKVFMGDAGSNLFGLLLGVFILGNDQLSVWVWLILLGQFIVDACLTVSVRLAKGEKIHEAHSSHAYQHLNRRFGSKTVLILTLLINVFWLLPMAYLAHQFPDEGIILLILAFVPLLIKDWLCGAGKTTPRNKYLS